MTSKNQKYTGVGDDNEKTLEGRKKKTPLRAGSYADPSERKSMYDEAGDWNSPKKPASEDSEEPEDE